MICKSDGCETKVPVKSILNKNRDSVFIKAVPDFKTFEKYFTYNLTPKLFASLDVLGVSYKDTLEKQQKVVQNSDVGRQGTKYKKLDTQAEIIEDIRRNNARINSEAERSIRRNSVFGRLPNHRSQRRGRGSIDFNIGFGNKRNRGNINIFKGW